MSDLDDLIPIATSIDINGETLEIRPVTMGRIPGVLREIGHLMPLFQADEPDIPLILMQGGEGLTRAAALLADMPLSWVESLNLAQMADLVGVLLEVNLDFFTRQVAPAMQRLQNRMTGLSSSSNSAPTATPTS